MRVFITGATGYIGRAVSLAFREAGHHVYGLVRSKEKARQLEVNEIIPIIGDLNHLEKLMNVLQQVEIIIHCAFDDSQKGVDTEKKIIDQFLEVSKKNDHRSRAIIYTSGVWVYGNTNHQLVDESSPLTPLNLSKWRVDTERTILEASSKTLRTVVLRPGVVYGGAGSLTAFWFESMKKTGFLEIAGEGNNHWAMVHYHDLAQAYVKAAEKEINGIVLNIVDNTQLTIREMALATAKIANVSSIKYLNHEEAFHQFGPLAEGLLVDQQISNERAKRLLGWYPKQPNYIQHVDLHYRAWLASTG